MKCESLSNSEDNSEDLDYGSRTIITITLGFLCHQQIYLSVDRLSQYDQDHILLNRKLSYCLMTYDRDVKSEIYSLMRKISLRNPLF